jgi:hypothetical protein
VVQAPCQVLGLHQLGGPVCGTRYITATESARAKGCAAYTDGAQWQSWPLALLPHRPITLAAIKGGPPHHAAAAGPPTVWAPAACCRLQPCTCCKLVGLLDCDRAWPQLKVKAVERGQFLSNDFVVRQYTPAGENTETATPQRS